MKFLVMELEVGVPNETWFTTMEPAYRGEPINCPTCGIVVTSLLWLPPYRAELEVHGKEPGDVAFGPGDNLLFSERFRAAWEAENLRGLVLTPIERIRIRPARLGKKTRIYFHATTRFFGTQVDIEHSIIEHEDAISCRKCYYGGLIKSVRGFVIDETSWTGEDIFYAWGLTGTVIVTDRVRQLRDDYGLTNVNLTPVEQYFWDPYNQWTPIDYSRDDVDVPDDEPDENNEAN